MPGALRFPLLAAAGLANAGETCRDPKGGFIPLQYNGCMGFSGLCFAWMNATCVDGRCKCADDQCVMGEQCIEKGECPNVTDGTCVVYGCDAWRNATCHAESAKCLCGPGTCPIQGECRPPGDCAKDTGGTCRLLGCSSWRRAACSSRGVPSPTEAAKCICGEDSCPVNGECVKKGGCSRYTGAECGWAFLSWGCDAGSCVDSSCLCPEGQCAVDGQCLPADGRTIQLSREWAAAQEFVPRWTLRSASFGLAFGTASIAAFGLAVMMRVLTHRERGSAPSVEYEQLEG